MDGCFEGLLRGGGGGGGEPICEEVVSRKKLSGARKRYNGAYGGVTHQKDPKQSGGGRTQGEKRIGRHTGRP